MKLIEKLVHIGVFACGCAWVTGMFYHTLIRKKHETGAIALCWLPENRIASQRTRVN
jgi:hypothetical protein